MDCLNSIAISTPNGEKHISVNICDIKTLDEPVDVLTVSAFYRSYAPSPGTLIRALDENGISIDLLSQNPLIDLREACNSWLSHSVDNSDLPVRRIGCIEMSPYSKDRSLWKEKKADIVASIQAYFHLLDIASLGGVQVETIAFPILGSGSQRIDMDFVMIPMLNECAGFLKRNSKAKEIIIIALDPQKAFYAAKALDNSYSMMMESARSNQVAASQNEPLAFISYSSSDKNIADNLCAKLEASGIKVWYAPRDINYNDYASAIVDAIVHCTIFIVILSKNSLHSNHVLNEIDLAFHEMNSNRAIRFCPLKIDEETLGAAFRYYLSRQHWMDAHIPPIENRLSEFVQKIKDGGIG